MRKTTATILGNFDAQESGVKQSIRQTLTNLGVDILPEEPISPSLAAETNLDAVFSSDLVIADMSHQNSNLMYELGLARGRRTPTFLIISSEATRPIPTTLAHDFFLMYDSRDLGRFRNTLRNFVSRHVV